MARWFTGLLVGGALWLGLSSCGGVVESSDAAGGGAPPQSYACPICANAALSCTVGSNQDTLTRAASSSTGCAFDFGSNKFAVDCDTQTFCIEGFGCSRYQTSGSGFTVATSLGGVTCSPAR